MHSLNAAIPSSAAYDLSSRTKTTAYVDWMPEASTQTHELLYTPDISEVVTEIVGQSGWTSGSPMAFIIEWVSGSGSRSGDVAILARTCACNQDRQSR